MWLYWFLIRVSAAAEYCTDHKFSIFWVTYSFLSYTTMNPNNSITNNKINASDNLRVVIALFYFLFSFPIPFSCVLSKFTMLPHFGRHWYRHAGCLKQAQVSLHCSLPLWRHPLWVHPHKYVHAFCSFSNPFETLQNTHVGTKKPPCAANLIGGVQGGGAGGGWSGGY